MHEHTDVAILGAGLTGLSAALHLDGMGARRRLFEKAERAGGHAVTVEDEGYRFDRTGHLLHLRDPEMRALALGLLGGNHLEIARRSMVFSHGVYTRYPFQANTFGLPPEVAFECVEGFVRAQLDKARAEARGESLRAGDFEAFCRIHFGEGFSRHFMIPYNTRLWGVAPREITADWCARFVPLPKVEDVIAGAVGLRGPELGYNARFVYPRLGIGALSDALAAAVAREGPVELERAPLRIDEARRELVFERDHRVRYESLVSTIPLPLLVRLLEHAPPHVREAASRLRCTHLFYLDVALNGPAKKDLHWVYVPEARFPFYRVGCYSNFSPAMAPPGKASLYVELADRAAPDLGEVLPRVAEGLLEMGLIEHPHEIRFARVRRIDFAYVIFDHAYFEAVEAVRAYLEARRIVSAGRYGGWNYSSMEDALLFGRDAARTAAAWASGEPGALFDASPRKAGVSR